MAVLANPFFLQFLDADGLAPVAGGFVYTYAAGTSIPKAAFTDFTETIQLPNPIPLDAGGRATIWISGSYKFVLTDANGVQIEETDNVTSFSVPSASGNSYFQSLSGDGSTTSFSLSQDLGTDENTILVFIETSGAWAPINPNAFTLTNTLITFASAPASGTNNIYIFAPSLLLAAAAASAAAAATSASNASASEVATAAIEVNVAAQLTACTAQATIATGAAMNATAEAGVATTEAGIATVQAGNAATSATQTASDVISANAAAAAAAASAAMAAGILIGSSTTSNGIATGSKTYAVGTGLAFGIGQFVVAASTASPANNNYGQVTAYTGGNVTINVTQANGTGTFTAWTISTSGPPGPTGAGSGTVNSGTANQLAFYAGTGTAVSGDANATMSTGALTLGQATTAQGSLKLSGSTSGTTTLAAPVSGGGTQTLQAGSDTIVSRATTDTLTNKTLSGSTNVLGGVTVTVGSDATGDIHYRNASGIFTRLASAIGVLHGGSGVAPSYGAVVEADITLANNTTNNVSTARHGFAPILPNDATKYLDGTGAYSAPTGAGGIVLLGTATASSSSSLAFTSLISSAYSIYKMVFVDLLPSASSSIGLEYSTNNGIAWTPNFSTGLRKDPLNGGSQTLAGAANTTPAIITGVSGSGAWNGWIDIVAGSSGLATLSAFFSSPSIQEYYQASIQANVSGLNALRTLPSAGNWTSGKIYLYGVKNT